MKTNSPYVFFFLSLCFLLSCDTPDTAESGVDLDVVRTEIESVEKGYEDALAAKDAEKVASFYADDAVSMPNNKPRQQGRAAILADIKADMASDIAGATVKFEVLNVWASGDLAVEEGRSVTTLPSGEKQTGKYIAVYEKRDGKYVIVRDIWNNDEEYDDDEDDEEDDEEEEEGDD